MNPLTNMRNLNKLNENEIKMGSVGTKNSWHNQYRESAWIFYGGMPFELTEGDVICIFSQYGEIVNLNLIRDKTTGKSKGFGFICYEDQRSTDLAVDNFNGTKILNRLIRVDHVLNYKPPKDTDDLDDITKLIREEGCSTSVVSANQKLLTQTKEQDHSSSHRDRSRDRDRERSRDIRSKEYDRNREKYQHERNRDRDQDRERDRDGYHRHHKMIKKERDDYERDRSDRTRERSRDRDRDKDRRHQSHSHRDNDRDRRRR